MTTPHPDDRPYFDNITFTLYAQIECGLCTEKLDEEMEVDTRRGGDILETLAMLRDRLCKTAAENGWDYLEAEEFAGLACGNCREGDNDA